MQLIAYPNFAWLLAVPAAFAVWRVRAASKAAQMSACAALLVFCVAGRLALPAADASHRAPDASRGALRVNSSFAIADFDGDRRPDLATAEIERSDSRFTRYLIRLRFTAGAGSSGQAIGVSGAFGLPQISAIDVNGDHALDLVVTAAGQKQPIAILLNDGRGKFSLAKPGEYPRAAVDSPWHWGSADRHIPDLAVLVPTRAPQADALRAGHFFAPRQLAESRFPTGRGFRLDPLDSSPLGRAPPQLA